MTNSHTVEVQAHYISMIFFFFALQALFDYHPYDDNLCPCPEAGLAFQYGDILAIGKKNKFLNFREIDFTKNSFFLLKWTKMILIGGKPD